MWGTLGAQGLDEVPLCPHCLHPARPDAHFCKRCMAPLSSFAAWGYLGTGTYEAIWSTAWIFWKAMTTTRPRRIHVIGVFLAFGAQLAATGVYLRAASHLPRFELSEAGGWMGLLFGGLLVLLWIYIAIAFMWRTWRNYAATPWRHADEVFE